MIAKIKKGWRRLKIVFLYGVEGINTLPMKFIGSNYGGFYIYTPVFPHNGRIYSCGIGEDISFDKEMIAKYNAKVFGFDPTPKSISWMDKQEKSLNFIFFSYGISDKDGEESFNLPLNENYVSGSVVTHENQGKKIIVPMKKISTLMKELGHEKLHLLKMDIEGSEFKVIDNILEEKIEIDQICLEIHDRYFEDGKKRVRSLMRKIRKGGYTLAYISDDNLLTFVRSDLINRR